MTYQVAKKVPAAELPPITPAMRKAAETVLDKAKVQLALRQPFFGQIVLGRWIYLEDNVPTAYVTPRGRIHVGVRFLATGGQNGAPLTVAQVVFLLAHEAMHYAMLHPLRRSFREHRKWNVACDAVINDILKESKVGEFIDGGVDMPGSRAKTAEKVYDELPDMGGKGGGGGGGIRADDDYSPGEGFDDLAEEDGDGNGPVDAATAREIEENVRTEIAKAAQVAKSQGKMPAVLERLVEEIVNPLTPWHILLERFMTNFIKSGISWRKSSRRGQAVGVYLPSSDRVPKMGPVVIVVDTSGSIGDQELNHFIGHINSIIERCRPEMVYVMPCDTRVHKVVELTLDDLPITPGMAKEKGMATGGGGTSFKPPFRKVEELGIDPDALIYLTDMYGDFPEKAPPYPVMWLSTTDVKEAPFGDVILYRMDE